MESINASGLSNIWNGIYLFQDGGMQRESEQISPTGPSDVNFIVYSYKQDK